METSNFLAFRRSIALLSIFAFIVLVQGPVQLLGFRSSYRWGHTWHKWCRWASGMKIRCHGRPAEEAPALFVANHTSYLDIPALGSILPATFIAKAEIKDWPMFGLLCKLQRTVFIERDRRKIRAQREELFQRLADGDSLILFPEGTSNNGTFMQPFKSALFSAAEWESEGRPLVIQPVTVAYTQLDDMVMGRRLRPIFAWYGDMSMIGHFWQLLGAGQLGIDIIFHPQTTMAEFSSRKELAEHCERAVAAGLSAALSGRDELATSAPAGEAAAETGMA